MSNGDMAFGMGARLIHFTWKAGNGKEIMSHA